MRCVFVGYRRAGVPGLSLPANTEAPIACCKWVFIRYSCREKRRRKKALLSPAVQNVCCAKFLSSRFSSCWAPVHFRRPYFFFLSSFPSFLPEAYKARSTCYRTCVCVCQRCGVAADSISAFLLVCLSFRVFRSMSGNPGTRLSVNLVSWGFMGICSETRSVFMCLQASMIN